MSNQPKPTRVELRNAALLNKVLEAIDACVAAELAPIKLLNRSGRIEKDGTIYLDIILKKELKTI